METLRFKNNGDHYQEKLILKNSQVLKERRESLQKDNGLPHVSLTKNGIVLKTDRYNRDFLVKDEDKKYKVTKIGDLCYNPANLKFGVITINEQINGVFSPIYVTFEISKKMNTKFAKYFYTREQYINKLRKFEEGTVYERMAVKPSDFLKVEITLPSLYEQEKIGGFLNSFDKLIQKQQEKIGFLKELKKGYLQQMFPVKESNIPKIRFKGFTDDWEQCNWKEKVDILTNMVNPINGEYNNLPHIGPGNIESFTGRLLDNVNTVGEDGLISGKFQFEKDDIIYGKINPQLGKYVYAPYKGLCSADSYVLRGKNGLNQTFLYTVLQTDKFYKYSVSVSMRSGMPKINRSELSAFDFIAPSTTEQDKIGTFILSIEKLIALHQRKLEGIEEMKKGYMQRLFA